MAQKHVWMHAKLEDGSPNPDHLSNWENTPELPEPVHVSIAGTVHRTTNGIHLQSWLRNGGQIVDDPNEEKPAEAVPVEEAPPAHATRSKAKAEE